MKKHKFNASITKLDNIRFDSKLEANYYSRLKLLQKAGEVLFFLRQTPFHLDGGTKLVIDFTVFYSNGDIEFVDVKGVETEAFKIKRREVEAKYPIKIKIVRKGS